MSIASIAEKLAAIKAAKEVTTPATQPTINLTTFPSIRAPSQWTDETLPWDVFVARILRGGIPAYTKKDNAPLIGLYRIRRGGRRRNEDIETISGICLDFDGVEAEHVLETAEALYRDGIAVLWHTTWSHGIKGECRRLILPLAEPVPADQYSTILGTIRRGYAPRADRQAGGVSQVFYSPSRNPSGPEGELHYLEGGGFQC